MDRNTSKIAKGILLFAIAVIVAVVLSTPAIAQQPETGPPDVGQGSLLYRSPLSGRYESVPLLHTAVSLDVRGPLASADVVQQYANSTDEPMEAVYVFPLPHDGAVYDMEIRIGDRRIRSVIKERAEAKRVYEVAKSEGKRAALVEQERPNIFTTSVANIMPGDKIEVHLRYVQPLPWENGRLRLVFPMVVGPRYIPGSQTAGHTGTGWSNDTDAVPDASRITPPVRHPESRSGHDISLAVRLDNAFDEFSMKCISHDVKVSRSTDGRRLVELARGATVPNRDFVLEIQAPESSRPRTSLFLSPTASGETHFLLTAYPPSLPPRERPAVEMLYMIDVSGSMAGTSIEQAREALIQALTRLRPVDRFAILAFSSGYHEFSSAVLPATPSNVRAATQYVARLRADGGTEMLPALLHLMRKPQTSGYLREIILLTDGDLGNEEQIFAALHSDLGNARLHTVAIGSAPNHFLATKMASYGRGTFTHIADISETKTQMSQLFEKIEAPVLADAKLSFDGVEVTDVYPERIPDLYAGQPLLIYGRISKGRSGKAHLSGVTGGERYDATLDVDVARASFHPAITTAWARQRMDEMMDNWRRADENTKPTIRAGIVAHAIAHNLVTQFTSLVAVEEVVANTSGRNKTVAVPTELPAGWQMENVFGAPATGTADLFLEMLGLMLMAGGLGLFFLVRR